NDQVLNLLDLKPKPMWWRYSIDELRPKMEVLNKEANRAHRLRREDPKKLDLFDTKILELAQHLQIYLDVAQLSTPFAVPPINGEGDWQPLIMAVMEARNTQKDNPHARALGAILVAYA